MRDPSTSQPSPPNRPAHPRGLALVLVISVLSLLTVLVVAMLSLASAERSGARLDLAIGRALLLEDTARNIAIAQIRQATSPPQGTTWISQPGAIRHFSSRSARATQIYKLYSSASMQSPDTGGVNPDLPPPNWTDLPHEWTDLNRPLLRDTTGDGRPDTRLFPVIDPTLVVEGFSISPAPGATATHPAPMPVRWLYVLEDGSVSPASPDGDGMLVPSATEDNPIVGRIAFWTDDESTKINVNSAAEPTPWDLPRMSARSEHTAAWHQPANREYQRYPGHPMTTALSPALFPNQILTPTEKEALYDWLPRTGTGGTVSSTVRIGTDNFRDAIQPQTQRLYASTHELALLPDRAPAPIAFATSSQLKDFFLSTVSRSPELNLHGLPRVSVWPSHISPTRRSALDGLLRFCSTIGGFNFHFERSVARHPTTDWTSIPRNQQLYAYLQALTNTPIPGHGGATLASRWGVERDQILTQAFDYIRSTNLYDPLIPINANRFSPNGDVTPIRINDTMGFGRQYMLSELGLLFICNGHAAEGITTKPPRPDGTPDTTPLGPTERLAQAAVLFEASALSPGFHELRSEPWSMTIEGLQTLRADGQDLGFPPLMTYTKGGHGFGFGHFWHNRAWGGQSALRATILRGGGGAYHLKSPGRFVLNDAGNEDATMSFSGGNLTIRIYHSQNPDPSQLVQTLTINLPSSSFPMPQLVRTGSSGGNSSALTTPDYWHTFESRFSAMGEHPHLPGTLYADPRRRWPSTREGQPTGTGIRRAAVFRPEDTLRTLVPFHGDMRLAAARHNVDASLFQPNAHYHDTNRRLDHTFYEPVGSHLYYLFGNEPGITAPTTPGTQLTDARYHWAKLPDVPQGAGLTNLHGDFDNGHAHVQDGAWINKPDEGNTQTGDSRQTPQDWPPYFFWNPAYTQPIHFSPNRIMPSPGMLGSLPTGVKAGRPWETLLFRPQPGHPGASDPPDHLFLDLFWMPVVEPYALSERFSTAGKVNLNYQIEPFTYLTRTTALQAALRSEEPLAIPNEVVPAAKLFRTHTHDDREPHVAGGATDPDVASLYGQLRTGALGDQMRKPIDLQATIAQFEERFAEGHFFLSPTEICEIHLVRQGESLSAYRDGTFWAAHVTTGDNSRERPYTNLLPRLTTRSNTFRIHYHVQVLQPSRSAPPGRVGPDLTTIVSDSRGSALVERFLDPEDRDLRNADPATTRTSLEPLHSFRILNTRAFP